MATVQLGLSYCSTQVNSVDVVAGTSSQFGSVSSADVIAPQLMIPMLENILSRAYNTVLRVPIVEDRVEQPAVRFSLEEMHDYLDHAAMEVATRVRARFLKQIETEITAASNAFDLSTTLRLLGTRVKVNDAEVKRVGPYHFRDLAGRGITFSDTYPVYTIAGGELRVYADNFGTNPNPSDATVVCIDLPEVSSNSDATAEFDGTDTIDVGSSAFVEARDLYIPIYLDDGGGNTAWAYISAVNSGTQIEIASYQDLSSIPTSPTTITITWVTPLYYNLSRILENAVVYLAVSDMFASMGEYAHQEAALKIYSDIIQQFGLPLYRLPIESEMNE